MITNKPGLDDRIKELKLLNSLVYVRAINEVEELKKHGNAAFCSYVGGSQFQTFNGHMIKLYGYSRGIITLWTPLNIDEVNLHIYEDIYPCAKHDFKVMVEVYNNRLQNITNQSLEQIEKNRTITFHPRIDEAEFYKELALYFSKSRAA